MDFATPTLECSMRIETRVESEGKHLAELRENWRSRGDILDAVLSLVALGQASSGTPSSPVRKFRRKTSPVD